MTNNKSAYEATIRAVALATLLFAAILASGQPSRNAHEFHTDVTTVTVVNAGVDALMVRCEGRVGKVEVKNLEMAGETAEQQFVCLLMMVDDGSYSYRDFIRMNGLARSFKMKEYWQKCRSARSDLMRVLDERTIIFLTHKHRRFQ